jgi:predicted transposase/invertase (TIGR01784 family)
MPRRAVGNKGQDNRPMITDPVFYRLFETSPETFFLVLGLSADAAKDMAARYQYEALEFKATAHRLDGVFRPKETGLPLYFLEVQFYDLPSVFAGLLAKVYTYLKQHDPAQAFVGVVLFDTRAREPEQLGPYQALLDAGLIRRYYLDEMPELANAPLGLSILYLIRQEESQAPATARQLIVRAKQEIDDAALRADLLELIETVILYKLPRLSRQEIQTMLQVHDIRETRVYQEAKEEGLKEGIEQGIEQERQRQLQEKLRSVAKMAAVPLLPEKIAEFLDLDVELVRSHLAKGQP